MKYKQSSIPKLKTSDTVMIKDNDADARLEFNVCIGNHLARACIYISVVCIYVMCLKYKKNIYRKKYIVRYRNHS